MTSQSAEQPDAALSRVGDYELLAKIGEGGMGIVHLAQRPGRERVALKILRPHIVGDDEARARLAREVNSLSRIRSRWVAEIVDADPWAPVPYVATRYVPGPSLHDHVAEVGPFHDDDLLFLAAGLAEGLASVHEVGVLHRDVKPSNVLMEGRAPILIDFGLARVADDPKLTHTGWLLGTPGYLAPEILYGDDATPASDVHSWAASVAYAAVGHPPYGTGPSTAIMDRVRRGEHDLGDLDGPLRDVLDMALAPEPDRRPTLDDVRDWLSDPELASAPRAEPTMLLPEEPPPGRRPAPTYVEEPGDEWEEPVELAPEPRPPGFLEKMRRALLVAAGASFVGVAAAAAPWVTLAALFVVCWLLRSGSLAASAVGEARMLRGRKWYDGVLLAIRSPWHLVQSIPGTLMLFLWSLGLAVAAALICYALALSLAVTLAVSGVVLALSLWWGPGGTRVRRPLNRLVHPVSQVPVWWALAMVLVLAAGVVPAVQAVGSGTDWFPADDRPFAGYRVPDWADVF